MLVLIYAKYHCPHLTVLVTPSQQHFVKAIHGLFHTPNLEPVHCGRCRQVSICLRIDSLVLSGCFGSQTPLVHEGEESSGE